MRRVHINISGRVQGVGFRAAARDRAKARSILGYATNLSVGRLEILAEGEDAALEEFVAWCRRGPSLAQVQDVSLTEETAQPGEFSHFVIRY